ncbi:RAB6-INTERACTING PROTEIN GORAB [Salix purpurea]|uniref:RAB6-interacting golgin n=1 Tax=Salix purpurea TaxID=77065 RepID=A0A9Q0WEH6_SALPP|nr:RAB6-INTERACTING PROTEIN GORAB [Salix purpurea]
MTTQKPILEQQKSQMQIRMMKNSGVISNYNESPLLRDDKDEEMSRSALAMFRAKEEEIEKKKMEVRDKVHAHLGRVEEATKRLAEIREELEALTDPTGKEVSMVRKKIDTVNRELKPLGLNCQKKEREYKEVLEAFNEKSKEKAQLVSKLKELVSESEKLRMKKLDELSKNVEILS